MKDASVCTTFYLLLIFILQLGSLSADDAVPKVNLLIGKWRVEKIQFDGKGARFEDVGINDTLVFKDSEVVGLRSGDKAATSELEILPGAAPQRFHRFVYSPHHEKLLIGKGIFKIVDSTLYWCEVLPASLFPHAFQTTKGDERTVVVLKRVKDNPTPIK